MYPGQLRFDRDRLFSFVRCGCQIAFSHGEAGRSQMKAARVPLGEFLQLLLGGCDLFFGLASVGKKKHGISVRWVLLENG